MLTRWKTDKYCSAALTMRAPFIGLYELNSSWPMVFSEQWNLASNWIPFIFFWLALFPMDASEAMFLQPSSQMCLQQKEFTCSCWCLISQQLYRQLTFSFGIPLPSMGQKIHLSQFIIVLKINYHHSLITTHDEFDSADPSSMQDTCHIWPCSPWVLLAQLIECPPCVQNVMGLIPVWDPDISLSHACAILINSSFSFHYRAQN